MAWEVYLNASEELPRTWRRRIVAYASMHKNLRTTTASQTINAQWYSRQWIVAKPMERSYTPPDTPTERRAYAWVAINVVEGRPDRPSAPSEQYSPLQLAASSQCVGACRTICRRREKTVPLSPSSRDQETELGPVSWPLGGSSLLTVAHRELQSAAKL